MTVAGTSTAGFGGPYLGRTSGLTGTPNLNTGNYSFACRIRWDTTNTTQDHVAIQLAVSTGDGSGCYLQRVGGETSTQISAYRTNTAGTTIDEAIIASSYGSTTAWHHVAVTYDGTTLRTYLDGVASGTVASARGTCTNAVAGLMGIIGPATATMADVCFFSRTLTAAEVLALSDQRVPMLMAHGDCFGWYPMLGDTVTVAGTDCSNAGNNASIINSGTGNPAITNVSVPEAWAQGAIWFPRSMNVAMTAAGTTNSTGSAAVAAVLSAVGTTNSTGAVTVSPKAPAVGTTNTTGASTQAAVLSVVGTTQTTGSADAPQALDTQLSSTPNIVGGWAYVSASATGQKLFWMGSAAADFMQIAVDGTTLTYELLNTSNGNHYLYQTTISLNTWFHVAFQKAVSTCTSYLNGAVVDSASFNFTGLSLAGTLQFHKNLSGMMRHAFKSNNGVFDVNVTNAMNSVGALMASSTPFTFDIWPLLLGGGRLNGMGFGAGFDLKVLGVVPEVDGNPPANWGGQNALFFKSAVTSMTASGTTQTSGSAAVTAQLLAVGTTQTTGSAAVAAVLSAVGTTQTTGSAVFANVLTASGTTQTSGTAAVVAQLLAVGTTQTSGSAAVIAQLTAVGTTNTTGAVAMTANGSSTIVPTGTTQTTGAVVIGFTQPMAAAGSVQTTGAVVMGITYAMTAAGTTQVTGAVLMSQRSGVGPALLDATSSRRWLGGTGARRRVRG